VKLLGLKKFHPTGSWNGWMTPSDGIMDGLLWCLLKLLVVFLLFKTLNFYLSCHEPWFIISKPLRANLDLICVMHPGLAFVWVFMHLFRSSKCVSRDLPGFDPATINGMVLYYLLMTNWSGLGDSTKLFQMRLSHIYRSRHMARWLCHDMRCLWLFMMVLWLE
jgi:hypothetical protein